VCVCDSEALIMGSPRPTGGRGLPGQKVIKLKERGIFSLHKNISETHLILFYEIPNVTLIQVFF
jgi:hypothetical protein